MHIYFLVNWQLCCRYGKSEMAGGRYEMSAIEYCRNATLALLHLQSIQRLLDIRNQVFVIFNAAGKANEIARNACRNQLFLVHLAMGCAGGMQTAASRVRNVRFDGDDLKGFHKLLRRASAAFDAEAHDAAGTLRHIFLRESVVFVGR